MDLVICLRAVNNIPVIKETPSKRGGTTRAILLKGSEVTLPNVPYINRFNLSEVIPAQYVIDAKRNIRIEHRHLADNFVPFLKWKETYIELDDGIHFLESHNMFYRSDDQVSRLVLTEDAELGFPCFAPSLQPVAEKRLIHLGKLNAALRSAYTRLRIQPDVFVEDNLDGGVLPNLEVKLPRTYVDSGEGFTTTGGTITFSATNATMIRASSFPRGAHVIFKKPADSDNLGIHIQDGTGGTVISNTGNAVLVLLTDGREVSLTSTQAERFLTAQK